MEITNNQSTYANPSNIYRVDGPVFSLQEALQERSGSIMRQLTAAEMARNKELDAQARHQPPAALPQPVHGQVVVDGQVYATIYASGQVASRGELPGLSMDGSGVTLAETRLQQIAKMKNGEIKRTDFVDVPDRATPASGQQPGLGQRLSSILQAMIWDSVQQQSRQPVSV